MKTLITYFSFSGNNALLAKYMSQKLVSKVLEIKEVKKRTGITIFWDLVFQRMPKIQNAGLQLSEFDHIIFMAPVWAGRIATPLKSFLKLNSKNINKYSFVTLCGGGGNVKLSSELERLTGKKPVEVLEIKSTDLIAGQSNPKKTSPNIKVSKDDLQGAESVVLEFIKRNFKEDINSEIEKESEPAFR